MQISVNEKELEMITPQVCSDENEIQRLETALVVSGEELQQLELRTSRLPDLAKLESIKEVSYLGYPCLLSATNTSSKTQNLDLELQRHRDERKALEEERDNKERELNEFTVELENRCRSERSPSIHELRKRKKILDEEKVTIPIFNA